MTLPAMPDDVSAAIARLDAPLIYTSGSGATGPLEIARFKDQYGNEYDRITWSYTNPNTGQPESTWFHRDPALEPWIDPAARALVEQRFTDVELANKFQRAGGQYNAYASDPKPDPGTFNSILHTLVTPSKEKGANRRPGVSLGGGSTIFTGGLGVYQEPELKKQKLGSK